MRVQVQVLLLPPMTGVQRRVFVAGVGSVGQLESPSRSKRDVPSGLARSTRAATAIFNVERTANGEAIRSEPGGSREGDRSTQLRSSTHVWLQWRRQRSVKPRPGVVNTGGSNPPTCTSLTRDRKVQSAGLINLRRRFKSGSRNQGSVAQRQVHLIVDQDHAGSNPVGSVSFRRALLNGKDARPSISR